MKKETKDKKTASAVGAPPIKKKPDLLTALALIGILLTFLLISYFIVFLQEKEFHSDFTDTMLWAKATFDSGKLIYEGFHYAAQLPFGGNLLMLVFMPFFGYSMTTHKLGMLLFLLLFVVAAVFFARSFKYSYRKSFFFVFFLCLILSLSEKLREIMYFNIEKTDDSFSVKNFVAGGSELVSEQ
jgi:hypothetical protein